MNPYLSLVLIDYMMIAVLGSANYSEREAASRYLEGREHHCSKALEGGIKSRDYEISRRCFELRVRFVDIIIDALEPLPEIDSAWYDVESESVFAYNPYKNNEFTRRYERMSPFLDSVGRDRPPWPNYYTATRLWLKAEITNGANVDELKTLLEEMHKRDRVFLWRYWHRNSN